MIGLLVPTRARQFQYERMLESVRHTSANVVVCSCSNGDDKYVNNQFPIDTPTVHMWNMMADKAMKNTNINLFMLGSDDIIFDTKDWDKALLDHYNALENKIHVYHLLDSRDINGTPHPIVSREYIEAMGYFIPPLFLHWFADSWTTAISRANGCFTHFNDYSLIHDKPSDHGIADETHNHIRRMGWHERDRYVNDTCQHLLQAEKNRLALHMRGSK